MTSQVIASITPMADDESMTHANTTNSTYRIARVLRANSLFSIVSGSALLIGSPLLDEAFGPPSWLLGLAGAGVLAFGLGVGRARAIRPVETGRAVMWADIAWVGATVVLAPFVAESFTVAGAIAAWAVAAAVAAFAAAEYQALRAS